MISEIHKGDIFSSKMEIPGEAEKIIVCGTNTDGVNGSGDGVAGRIGQDYNKKFQNLGSAELGHAHIVSSHMEDYVAIVTNERKDTGEHDWSSLYQSLSQGFKEIYEKIIMDIKHTYSLQDLLAQYNGETIEQIDYDSMNPINIAETIKLLQYKLNEILPPVRTVLIGAGNSGRQNEANVADSLRAMLDSKLNLHLFLKDDEQAVALEAVKKVPFLQKERGLYTQLELAA